MLTTRYVSRIFFRLFPTVQSRAARIRSTLSSRALENGFRKTFKERHHANLREDPYVNISLHLVAASTARCRGAVPCFSCV